MADINELQLRITADTKGLQQVSSESKKVASELERSGKGGRSTFSQFNQELDRSALKIGVIGGLVGGLAAQFAVAAAQALRTLASLPVRLFEALLSAGRSAEQQILRIGTVLRIPEEEARRAFEAIREFAAPLPQTTDEIVNGFIALEAINLAGTEENLKRVANAALATGQRLEDITTVLASTEVEPLRRLGIELDRTGKKAVIAFKDIRIEVDKSSQAVREGLLELFARAFPDGIERSQRTLNTAVSTMKSLLSDLIVGPGSDLSAFLAEVVGEINKWIAANKELIEQKLVEFVGLAKSAIEGFAGAVGIAVDGISALNNAFFSAPTHLGGFRLETESTQAAVDLLSGSYGPFIDSVKVSEGIYDDTASAAQNLSNALGNMSTETHSVAVAMATAKGPVDEFFASIVNGIKQINSTPAFFGFTPIAEIQKQQAAVVNLTTQASKMGGVFSGEVDPALKSTALSLGDTAVKTSFLTDEQKQLAKEISEGVTGMDAFAGKGGGGMRAVADETDKAKSKIDSLNNSMKNQIETLRQSITALEGNEFAVIEMAKAFFLAKGGSKELADEFERLSKQQLNVKQLQDFKSEIADLNREIAIFGQSPEFVAKYDAEVLKAELRTKGFGEEIVSVVDGILAMQQVINRLEFRQKLESEFKSLDIVEVQVRNVREEFANLVNTVLQIAASPELSEKFGINFARANEIIVQATAQAQKDIKNIELQAYADRLQLSDSFWDQMKGGFLEFALAVESNGELAAQFFADTLSQMSQNFSDFFYNVLTGKFDDLVDVAKNAFRSILRAFLDMVAAIATRQIVVNIAGSLGIGKGAQGAGGSLGIGKDALGLAGGAIGLGGIGGGGLTLGADTVLFGSSAGSLGLGGATIGTGGGLLAGVGSAIPYIGAALAAAAVIIPLLSGLFKKTPRIDIDFDSVKTDLGRRAAIVNEFLDPDFFADNIGQVSVKRKAGLGVGGDEKILELIQQRIQETVEGIQDIIRRLPAELFNSLNETLLNAEIDIDTVIGGERLLEFDAKGKKIAEKFQAFIEGELPAKFFAAIRESFFDPAFRALGVSAEGTQQLIDDFMAKLEAAGSREERAIIGQEFIDTFSAFVDAFNIVSGNANDAIGQTMNTIKSLANQLGFEAVPSIEQLRMKLGELIENAELDPETVQMYADLRNAIVSLTSEVVNSITGLIGKMQSLNQTMASLGLATVDLGGYLSQAASQIQSFLQNNQGELSLSEQEAFLDQLTGIANAMLQEEMAAFNAEQERLRAEAQAAYEAQRAQIQGRIDGFNREKEAINEAFRARIDALNEELKLAQDFAAATESIRNTLDGIIFSQQSIFTAVERVNLLQGNIADLQNQLANADDPSRQLDLIGSLEDAFKTLFDTAGEAFGVNSPEFVSIFDQVTGGLSDLANLTENRGRSAEEIQAEIERLTAANEAHLASIDARIESAQAQLSSLQQQTVDNTFVASQELQDLYSYIQSEYQRLLDERFKQLGEISEFGFQNEVQGLEAVAGLMNESLVTLKDQTSYLAQIASVLTNGGSTAAGVPGFASGSGGLMDFGQRTLAFLHGREAVFTEPQLANLTKKLLTGGIVSNLANQLPRTPEQVLRERTADIAGDSGPGRFDVYIHSDNPAVAQIAAEKVADEVEKRLVKKLDPLAKNIREAADNRSRKARR